MEEFKKHRLILLLALLTAISGCSRTTNELKSLTPATSTLKDLPEVGKVVLVKYYEGGEDQEEVVILGYSSTKGSVHFVALEFLPCECNDVWWSVTHFRQRFIDYVQNKLVILPKEWK